MRKKSETTLPRAERYKVISRRRRVWHKIVGALACVVVFITTYMLILPAITMEKPICGFEEHTHTAECYEKVTGTVIEFVCNPPEPCAHTHNEYCYDKDGNLICTLPEIEQHIHTEGCYAESESVGGHVHTDECYTEQRGELICGQDESAGHTHDDSCYDTVLTCTEDEGGGHSHDDSCYDEQGELVCGQDEYEGHTHDDGCYETVLVCAEEESEGHAHTEDCYEHERVLSCGLEEAAGLEAEPELICGIEELPVHNHTSECIIENPVNSDALTCTLDEDENHTHTELCYGEWRLSCGFEEHTHTEDCYPKKDSSGNSKAPSDVEEAEDIQEKVEDKKSGGNNSGEKNEDGEDSEGGAKSEDGDESKTKLTEEQIAEANEVTKLIAVLPDTLEAKKKLSELEQAGDEQAYKAYFMDLVNKSLEAYSRYSALSEEQKKLVIGADKLERLEWLYSAQAFDDIPERLDGDFAYISDLKMNADAETTSKQAIRTGSAPFDGDDTAGNDKSATNNIVRTFDTVSYTFTYNTKCWDTSPYQNYKKGTVYFEFLLPLTSDQARFETESMGWLEASQEIKYKVEDVTVGGKDYQVLHGSFLAVPNDTNLSAIGASTNEMSVVIRVKSMKNGEIVQPSFTLWLFGNDVGTTVDDGVPKKIVSLEGSACATPTHGTEYKTITPDPVTVSAAPRYNVAIKQAEGSTTSYFGDFNFGETGNELAFNKDKGTVTGRIVGYGITLQLYGKSGDHGLRGVELPDEKTAITFDITLKSLYKPNGDSDYKDITDTDYGLLVWSADKNSRNETIGGYTYSQRDGRDTLMDIGPHTMGLTYAKGGAPLNNLQENAGGDFVGRTCWNGGYWSFTQDETYSNVVHVTVSGFEVELDTAYDSNGKIVMRPFPYGNAGDQYSYYNPDTLKNNWDIQIGCFSAGELWVVQPYYDTYNGNYIADDYGQGSLAIQVSDSNLNMKSAGGTDFSVQANTGDDSALTGLAFEKKGTIKSEVWYNKYDSGYNNPLTDGCMSNGKDWATAGTKIALEEMISNDSAEGMNTGVAYDTFVKFDNKFFEPDGSYQCFMYPLWETEGAIKYLYAGKSGGWVHKGLNPNETCYDDDMNQSTADSPELTFYTSLSDLKADGKECVGILIEYRGLATTGMNHLEQVINGQIKSDCPTLPTGGYVYMVTHNNRSWNKGDVARYVAAYKALIDAGETPSTITAEQAEAVTDEQLAAITDNDYDAYARSSAFPSHSDNNVTYDNFPSAYWIKEYGRSEDYSNAFVTMKKSTYGDSGYTGGDNNQWYLDSCLVVGLYTNITKQVAQTVSASDPAAKRVFDLDQNQRVVDYRLIPSTIRVFGEGGTVSLKEVTTSIYIEDTLPAGLTYIPGSSYWGGNYTQDVNCRKKGTVTGGTQIEPSIVVNADDTTTLTWTLNDVPIPANTNKYELAPLYFSCDIGNAGGENDVENQQQLINIVEIHSDCDKQLERTVPFGNRSETSIEILKTAALSLSKFAEQSVVDRGSEMSFSMNVGNNSGTAITNSVVVESLPYNGGINGSSFNGNIYVTEFSAGTLLEKWSSSSSGGSSSSSSQYAEDHSVYVDGTPIFDMDSPDTSADDTLMNGLTFYYTTDTNKRVNTSKNYLIDSKANTAEFTVANGWHEINFDDNAQKVEGRPLNIATNIPEDKEIVQIAAVGNIPAGQTLKMHITLNLPDANSGDTVVNGLSQGELESYARSSIVLRTLEGMCWHDDNADGVQNDNELRRLSGIKVKLLKLKDDGDYTKLEDYEPYHYGGVSTNAEVTIETGKQVSVLSEDTLTDYTDPSDSSRSKGCYKFTELPEGTFAVKFEDGTSTTMSKYIASPVDMGGDDRYDSDGIAVYNNDRTSIQYTYILNVEMPATADMKVALYDSRYHDSGFYDRGPELPTTGGTGTKLYIIGGLLLTAAAGISLLYRRKRHGREDSLLF